MRPILIDGRGCAGGGTGIPRYVRALVLGMKDLEADDVRVLCFRSDRDRFRMLGVRPWAIPSGRLFRPWQLPPVALTHGTKFDSLPRRGAKTVVTIHDLSFLHFPNDYPIAAMVDLSDRLAADQWGVDLAICDSAATEADVLDAYPGFAGRTTVIPLGVDSTWFDQPDPQETSRVLHHLGIRTPYLLHLGALVPMKNLETVVRAWMLARLEHPELALVLAGPDIAEWKSDLATIHGLVAGRDELRAHLHLVGYVDDPIAHALMAAAQVYVCASKWEGFGLPVLEAMAAGVPVVATNIPATKEVAGETIIYVPVSDVEATAEAIGRVIDGSDLARTEAAQVRARIFSWSRCAERTLMCYRSLIAESI